MEHRDVRQGSSELEALLSAVHKATNVTLFQPDWAANRICVDGLNHLGKIEIAYEISEELQKKLNSPEIRVIILTMHLIDAFVNECGQKWHFVMNDKGFCDEIMRVARKFWGKGGSENVAIVDTCGDLIQSWGQAFLPHRQLYPNIVEIYISLQKIGFPFKRPNQPGVHYQQATSSSSSRKHHVIPTVSEEDAALAVSLQAALNLETAEERSRNSAPFRYDSPSLLADVGSRSRQASSSTHHINDSLSSHSRGTDTPPRGSTRSNRPSVTLPTPNNNSSVSTVNPRELMESLRSAANLLRDLLSAATSAEDIRRNELATDIAAQIETNQSKINEAVEQSMNDGELVERLFRVNDDSQTLVRVFQEIKNGNIALAQAKQKLHIPNHAGTPRIDGIAAGPPPPRSAGYPQVQQQPPQYTSTAPRPPARGHSPTTTRRNGHRVNSLEGDLTVITAEADPFAPQAIDALFDVKPASKESSRRSSPANQHRQPQQLISPAVLAAAGVVVPPGHPAPPADIPAKALMDIDSDLQSLDGTVIASAADPFAPEALDALFGEKPPTHRQYVQPHPVSHQPHPHYPAHYPGQVIPVPIPPGYAYPGQVHVYPGAQVGQAHHPPVAMGVQQPIQRQQQAAAMAYPNHNPHHANNNGQQSHAPNSASGTSSQKHQQQHAGNGFDPFSPAGLDALFVGSTVPPTNPHGNHSRVSPSPQDEQHSHRSSRSNSNRNSPGRKTCEGVSGDHHPPPTAGTNGNRNSNKAAADPFSPEALDAMLGLSSQPAVSTSTSSRPRSHPTNHAAGNHRSDSPHVNNERSAPSTHAGAAARDPFSPEALDALFDAPSSTKSAGRGGGHHHAHNSQQHHSVPHAHGQQQGYPPSAVAAAQYHHPQSTSPQVSPHGNQANKQFFPPAAPAMPVVSVPGMPMLAPGMMYVAGPNGMVYTAPANMTPPPGYFPIPTYTVNNGAGGGNAHHHNPNH